jgi:multiple sugar transport system substrate-binding protein
VELTDTMSTERSLTRRHFLSALAAMTAAVPVLQAACTMPTPAAPAAAPTTGPGSASSNSGASAATRVSFWNDYTGGNGKAMDAMLASFTKETGIQVEQQQFAFPDLMAKLRTAGAAGQNPDAATILTFGVPSLANDGLLDEFTPEALGGHGFKAEDYPDTPWNAGNVFNNKRYGLPLDFVQFVMYLNDQMFKEAGLVDSAGKPKVPATKDELFQVAKQFTKGSDTFGLNIGPADGIWWFENYLFQNGIGFFTEDLKKSALDQPAAIEVAQFWGQMSTEVASGMKVSPPNGTDASKAFIGQKLAMSIDGTWINPVLVDAKIPYTVAPVPNLFKNQKVWGIGHNFTLFKQATPDPSRREAAWKLIRWLTDNSDQWTLTGGVMGATKKVQADPRVLADPLLKVAAAQVPNLVFAQTSPRWEAAELKATPVVQGIYQGSTDPKAGMLQAAQDINAIPA